MEKRKIKDRYELLNKISEGAFGEVYLCVDTHTFEKRAIKEDKLISKFEDKYFSYVSVEQYDYDIGELTESEMEDDSNLYKRFRDIIKYHFDNKDDADEILYCNCNYILLDVDDIGVT